MMNSVASILEETFVAPTGFLPHWSLRALYDISMYMVDQKKLCCKFFAPKALLSNIAKQLGEFFPRNRIMQMKTETAS